MLNTFLNFFWILQIFQRKWSETLPHFIDSFSVSDSLDQYLARMRLHKIQIAIFRNFDSRNIESRRNNTSVNQLPHQKLNAHIFLDALFVIFNTLSLPKKNCSVRFWKQNSLIFRDVCIFTETFASSGESNHFWPFYHFWHLTTFDIDHFWHFDYFWGRPLLTSVDFWHSWPLLTSVDFLHESILLPFFLTTFDIVILNFGKKVSTPKVPIF